MKTLNELKQTIIDSGISLNDPRLKINKLEQLINENPTTEADLINIEIRQNNLLRKIIQGNLIIPLWKDFTDEITKIYQIIKENNDGKVADYIPQLAKTDPNLFCISVCTIDGQVFQLGDTDACFSVQSCSKPITYGIAVESNNEKYVHTFVGHEPSGRNFNELCLNHENIPHNPLINSGAIMATSLIKPAEKQAERFEFVMDYWKRLIGEKINFNNTIYLSEKDTADRNFCLAYMMQEKKAFSYGKSKTQVREWYSGNLVKNLELYFQNCSIECNTRQMSYLASTFANGGINVFTNDKVFGHGNVKNILSLMYSCGMYDYSGEWSYLIGIPAKSGVSGIIYGVVQNVCGIAVYSPKLDGFGNSIKGVQFFRRFGEIFNVHCFDSDVSICSKKPLTKQNIYSRHFKSYLLLEASSRGDLNTLKQLIAQGVNINSVDYDNRSALHLACCTGNTEIVKYLLENGANIGIKDRWNNTPLDDVKRSPGIIGGTEIISMLSNNV